MWVLETLRSSFSKGMNDQDKITLEKLIGQDSLSADDQKTIETILAKEENKKERPKIIAALKEKFTGEAHASLQIFLDELDIKLWGYSLATVWEKLQQKDAKTLFGIYSSVIWTLLWEIPETKDLKATEKESLKIVMWKLFSEQFSATGILSKSIQWAASWVDQDTIINGGIWLLSWDDTQQVEPQKGATSSWPMSGEDLQKKLKATYEGMSWNFKVFLEKCPADVREKIFTYPTALEAIVRTGKFSNEKWWIIDITEGKTLFTTPDLHEKVIAGDQIKYLSEVAKSSDAVFAENGKWKKFAPILWYIEDFLKWFGSIWAIFAWIIAAIRKALGWFDKISFWNLLDWKVKTSLENLQKFATNPETAKLNIKNVGFLAWINAENGKEFFTYLKWINIDIKDVNFWPLVISWKNADGSDGGDKLKDGTPLKKVADFFSKRLSGATTQDEFIAKIKWIKEADEFKDTKPLETVVMEHLSSAKSFPITIKYNNEDTVVNVEENPNGLIVLIGGKKFQVSDIREHSKLAWESALEYWKIVWLQFAGEKLQLKTTFDKKDVIDVDQNTLTTIGSIIANLMGQDVSTYTTENQILAGEYKLSLKFDKIA